MFKLDIYVFPQLHWGLGGKDLNLEQIVSKYDLDPMIIPAWDRDGISDIISSQYLACAKNVWGDNNAALYRLYLLKEELDNDFLYLRLYGPYGPTHYCTRIASWRISEQRWELDHNVQV